MKPISVPALGLFLASLFTLGAARETRDPIADTIHRLTAEITGTDHVYQDLKELTAMGHRLSGSPGAENAVRWGKAKMETYGFDRVFLQPVQVPRWTRGAIERAAALSPEGDVSLRVTALGNSVATNGALEAEVIEVKSLREVDQLGAKVRGKIVFYNRPMDPTLSNTFQAYGEAGDQRFAGPGRASKYGAAAALVRSMTTLADDDHPHTGVTIFPNGVSAIPAAALSTHAANELSRQLKANPGMKVRLELSAEQHDPVTSHNVVGEIRGATRPDEIVVVGGHLDSWDLATGAHDDGTGVVQSIETLRAMHALGIRPARTVRAVLFMSEEIGANGADEYARLAQANGEKHVGALESDCGGFAPQGFSIEGDATTLATVQGWAKYLIPLGALELRAGGAGTDVEPLGQLGVATFSFDPVSTHYFDYHHSELDDIDAVDPKELKAGAAAMAAFTYLMAEHGLPPVTSERLPTHHSH